MALPKVPIEKVNKMPLAYALMIVGGLLGIFATKFFDNNEKVIEAYKIENATLKLEKRAAYKNCDSLVGFWRDKYLAGVEYAVQLQRLQDSTNRAALNQPNKQLLKVLKRK